MRKVFLTLVLFFCCMAAETALAQMAVTSTRAVEFARRIVGNDSCDYYLGQVDIVTYPNGLFPSRAAYWLVFVDEEPNSGWEHPCKYVYISRYQSPSTIKSYFVVDSVCPPTDVPLTIAYKPNRYGDNMSMKPYVPKVLANEPNPVAGNTYAVILNGGMQKESNNERYWNDCSYIYKVLRNTYDIPKQNIKVIMSDGTDEGEDMNNLRGYYCSSPLDLDDDSIADVEYAATKANLQTVMNDMAQKLTDDDHLLIFVTGHGGYDPTKNSSYMYLWDKVMLYPDELNSYLEPINAGFISIVMGQCYSGGFIEPLKKTNRVIVTACAENERSYGSINIPFDEFLYHWTSAVNGYDAYGKRVMVKAKLPIIESHVYAAKKDIYANGGSKYVSETPQINYFTNSVVYGLSLAKVPPTVDLCFDKYSTPVISELVTRSYVKSLHPGGSATSIKDVLFPDGREDDFYDYKFWNNPYIWIRNQKDGKDVHVTEKPIIEEDRPLYVYTQVRNKGVKPYKGEGIEVKLYWAQSNVVITEEQWKGYSTTNDDLGGEFGCEDVLECLQPGESTIVTNRKFFEGKQLRVLQENPALCLLAFLRKANSKDGFISDSNRIAAVWKTDKLGQSNVTPVDLRYDGIIASKDSMLVRLSNSSAYPKNWMVDVKIINYMDSLRSAANVALRLSSDLVKSWDNGGRQCVNIKDIDSDKGAFQVDCDSASLNGVMLQPYQRGKVGIKCNFFAENGIYEKKQFDVDVSVRDAATGQILGGETFRITQHPRPAINPQIETARVNGTTTLKATNVSENVIYRWYDGQGTLVGEGERFIVPAGVSMAEYKVKAEALSDGAISYSAPVQAESSSISSVQSTTGAVNVILEGPAGSGTTLRLASATGSVPVTEYSVEAGSTACSIPAGNLPSGVYQVTMVENGVVTGIKKFTK